MKNIGLLSLCAMVSAEDQFSGIPELIYFDAPGRGQVTRDVFTLGGVEFKDTRVSAEDWPKIKTDPESVPGHLFGHMPVIKRGPYELGQSQATAQYASDVSMAQNKIKLTAQQRALDMMLLGTQADCQYAMYDCLFGDDETKAKGMAALSGKITPQLEGIERQYKGDATFIYNTKESGPSVGDIAVQNLVESTFPGLKALGFDLSPFPKISAIADAVTVALDHGSKTLANNGPEAAGKPELIYFDGPGRAEISRLAFALGSVEYTDTRISKADWPKIKTDPESIPGKMFGHMPVIKHGDFVVAQSQAVSQYAADLGINAGSPPTAEQRGLDTMLLGAHADLQTAMYRCLGLVGDDAAKCIVDLPGAVKSTLEGIERQYNALGPYIYSPESMGPTLGDLALLDAVTSFYPGLKALGVDMKPYEKISRMIEACFRSRNGNLAAYLKSRPGPPALNESRSADSCQFRSADSKETCATLPGCRWCINVCYQEPCSGYCYESEDPCVGMKQLGAGGFLSGALLV